MRSSGLLWLSWATLALSSALPPLGYDRVVLRELFDKRHENKSKNEPVSCFEAEAPSTKAPHENVWRPLTGAEHTAVWDLLHDPASGLNLTHPSKAVLTDNYVWWVDALPSNKTDVLPYLNGSAPAPPKYARVIIFEGGKADPDSQEYMVGPLPVSHKTKIDKLDYIYNGGKGGKVPYNSRYFDGPRSAAVEPLIAAAMTNVSDITAALFQGGVYFGRSDNRTNITPASADPMSLDGLSAFRNIMFRFPGPASYLVPLDFFLLLDISGTDPSLYSVKGFVTNEKYFPTEAALRAAFEAGELSIEFDQTKDYSWALLDYKPELGTRDLEERMAPATVELGGKRYKIDRENQYIEYLGWSFYLSHSRTLGNMLFDIKFKGERILYELSMQEAAAQYGGNQPKAANTVYHDTYYQLGNTMGTLLEGFDCPYGSTFLNITYGQYNSTAQNINSICIFETDMNFPVSRHRSGASNSYTYSNFGAVKGSALIIRAIATVGNYDYMFDYVFHVDGSLEVIVRASGYLQSSFYYPDQGKWGPRIQQATQGSLHDHIITFKADFDILDTKNTLQVTELIAANVTQPWFPELGEFEQLELKAYPMRREQQFNYAANNQAMYVVLNENEKNAWGTPRGYRILPGRSNIHLATMNSPWSLKNMDFAKSHLAVTRQHDNEPFANSIQNVHMPQAPQQDFGKFFDDECIENEDVVVWFNLGMHHFVRSEDVPVTLYTEAYSSIVFAPQNFFDRAQDGDLLNRRWMEVDSKTGEMTYETYGVGLDTCAVVLEEPVLGWHT